MGWENVGDLLKNQKFKQTPLPSLMQAPEMKKKSFSFEADVWCIGVIVACLCPKEDRWDKQLFSNIDKVKKHFEFDVESLPKIKVFKLSITRTFFDMMLKTNKK